MALTRKQLHAMALTDEQVESVVELHAETVNALKAEIEGLKGQLGDYEDVKKELETLKKGDYKKKYDDLNKEYADYKASKEQEAENSAKEAAARAYFEGKKIIGKNLEIAMRGAKDEINGITLKDGKIEDTALLDGLVAGTFASLIVTESTKGADTATPPSGGGGSISTKEDILKISNTAERQAAIKEHPELFK